MKIVVTGSSGLIVHSSDVARFIHHFIEKPGAARCTTSVAGGTTLVRS